MQRRHFVLGAAGAAGLGLAGSSAAQQVTQSDNLLSVVAPFGAGGLNDVIARLYARKAAPWLNRRIIVENKADESGFRDDNPLLVFAGLVASARAPAPFVDELAAAGDKVVRDPEYVAQLKSGGLQVLDVSRACFTEMLRSRSARCAEIIGALRISLT